MDLLDRKFKILSAVIERYVLTGEPVGSKAISEDFDLLFSSATIRNEMANLVNFGYLTQPHISAGRVPSDRGYRLYINKFMPEKLLSVEEKNLLSGLLSTASIDPESLLEKATEVLAEITGFTAIMTTPPNEKSKIRDIKFVQISRRGGMLVLITSGGMVKNKLFRCEYDLNSEILNMFEKMFKEEFRGKYLGEVNAESVNIMVSSDREISMLLLPVIDVLLEAVKEANDVKVKIYGQKNLLSIPGITTDMVIDIFNFLEDKNKVLDLFNSDDYGINFIVGEENNYRELKEASVASAKYNIAGKSGVLGVIGPTRMDYGAVAMYLQHISSLVGVFLERMLRNE